MSKKKLYKTKKLGKGKDYENKQKLKYNLSE